MLQFGIFVIYKSFRVPVYSAQMFPSMFAVQFTKVLQFDVFVIHKSVRVPVSSICCSHDCLLDCYSPIFFAIFFLYTSVTALYIRRSLGCFSAVHYFIVHKTVTVPV